jgi:hypothetical protein
MKCHRCYLFQGYRLGYCDDPFRGYLPGYCDYPFRGYLPGYWAILTIHSAVTSLAIADYTSGILEKQEKPSLLRLLNIFYIIFLSSKNPLSFA